MARHPRLAKASGFRLTLGPRFIALDRSDATKALTRLSSVPGQVHASFRQQVVHTLNLAHLLPVVVCLTPFATPISSVLRCSS